MVFPALIVDVAGNTETAGRGHVETRGQCCLHRALGAQLGSFGLTCRATEKAAAPRQKLGLFAFGQGAAFFFNFKVHYSVTHSEKNH